MKTGVVALLLAALALGAAGYALTREPPPPQRAPMRSDRIEALEARVEQLAREIATLRPTPRDAVPVSVPGVADVAGPPRPHDEIEAIVEEAVDRKAKAVVDEFSLKANKKPAMDVFAKLIELTPEQRRAAERVVVAGQHELHEILRLPTEDGTVLLDDLVEIAARGIAEPGRDHGFGRWLGRVLSEKIPGTDQTYGARIESVKQRMRATFKREWTEEQYREFQAWGVDPTEIQNVPDSPNQELFRRIQERARELGRD